MRLPKYLWLVILIGLLVNPHANPTSAHSADMYFHIQTLRITSETLAGEWSISPGPLLAAGIWAEADKDRNNQITEAEALTWAKPHINKLEVILDGVPAVWELEAITWPTDFLEFEVGEQTVQIYLKATLPVTLEGEHQVHIHNAYEEPFSITWFKLYTEDGITFETPAQAGADLDIKVWAGVPGKEQGAQYHQNWESGTPLLPTADQTLAEAGVVPTAIPRPQDSEARTILTGLVRSETDTVPFYIMALTVALVLGALHALTPGHGKTIVATYLLGSQGNIRQAMVLGSIVTVTHTGSVFALGIIVLAASQYILPTAIFPVLEITSGLLIMGFGASLLYQRIKNYQQAHQQEIDDKRNQSTVRQYDNRTGRTRISLQTPIRESGPPHKHKYRYQPGDKVTWRALVTLGISGGLVPCPDAVAILLVAVTLNRVALGLSLIVAFSLGLAIVLIAIGTTIVQSKRVFARLKGFSRLETVVPLASAVVVLMLGVGLTVTAVQGSRLLDNPSGTATSNKTVTPPTETAPSFDIKAAQVIYMDTDNMYRYQIFVIPISGGAPVTLTQEPLSVLSYDLAPDGRTVIYSALREDGGTGIWSIDVNGEHLQELLACPTVSCDRPVWGPTGQWLIYEKFDATVTAKMILPLPSLWWLDLTETPLQTYPLFQDSDLPGYDARFAADGTWLSYTSPNNKGAQLYNLLDSTSLVVPTQTVGPVIWGPQGTNPLLLSLGPSNEQFRSYLLALELGTQSLTNLSGSDYEDTNATWSPAGNWIAVSRRALTGELAKLDEQIWVMEPDGRNARPLTDIQDLLPGALVWSPDGEYLLFEDYGGNKPEIWLLTIKTGDLQKITGSGSVPAWVY